MLRLWREIHAEKSPISASASISLVTHVVLIVAAVAATARPVGLADGSDVLANRPYYIPPPNRISGQAPVPEHLEFIALTPAGAGSGFGRATFDSLKRVQDAHTTMSTGDAGRDSITLVDRQAIPSADSVFTQVEVDSVVRRDPASAAPSYPPELLKLNVEGFVDARYVVDTTGLADSATFTVMFATHPAFVTAVREALPGMRFAPAQLQGHKVRQLVEQRFSFRITPPVVAATPKKP